jgi:hypothetical protein
MNSRAGILAAIRNANVAAAPIAIPVMPAPIEEPLVDRFVAVLEQVGGRSAIRRPDQSLHGVVAALTDPESPSTVVRGRFGVAENGSVYVDAADLGDRTDVVRGEHLVLVIPATAIVATMHEAVRLIPPGSRCGWFLSGPSKTADIEQSLVIGAQGARTLHVILEE